MQNLVEYAIRQAAFLIKEQNGEFYPFAVVSGVNQNPFPIAPKISNENPAPEFVVAEINKMLEIGFENGEYLLSVVALNVSIKRDSKLLKDAIQMNIKSSRINKTICLLYSILDNEVEFGAFIPVPDYNQN